MRLRTTAPPSAFLMLKPKRLCGCWFARKKTVKWELERRFPVRYTASNSPRRTKRAARGNSRRPGLLGREPMASLLAACRQHFAAALALHAHAKPVRFSAPAFARLIRSLRQSDPPCVSYPRTSLRLAYPLDAKPHNSSTFGATPSFRCVPRCTSRLTATKHTTNNPAQQPFPNQ